MLVQTTKTSIDYLRVSNYVSAVSLCTGGAVFPSYCWLPGNLVLPESQNYFQAREFKLAKEKPFAAFFFFFFHHFGGSPQGKA